MVESVFGDTDLEKAFEKVLKLFYDDEPLLSFQELTDLRQRVHKSNKQSLKERLEYKEENCEEIGMLERDVFILNQFREQISRIESGSDDSWTRYKDTDEEKIFYKLETGFRNCTLFMQKVVEAPAINLMATLAEAQLYN